MALTAVGSEASAAREPPPPPPAEEEGISSPFFSSRILVLNSKSPPIVAPTLPLLHRPVISRLGGQMRAHFPEGLQYVRSCTQGRLGLPSLFAWGTGVVDCYCTPKELPFLERESMCVFSQSQLGLQVPLARYGGD